VPVVAFSDFCSACGDLARQDNYGSLPGGYSRDEACHKLADNHGVIASSSRARTEGLTGPADRRRVRCHGGRGDHIAKAF